MVKSLLRLRGKEKWSIQSVGQTGRHSPIWSKSIDLIRWCQHDRGAEAFQTQLSEGDKEKEQDLFPVATEPPQPNNHLDRQISGERR